VSIFSGISLPETIYEASSQYNQDIKVLKVGEVLKLVVDGFTQSLSKNSKNVSKLYWGGVVNVLKEQIPENPPKNILILGMGGGTIPHLLRKEFPTAKLVSVEIDPVIVEIARKYFDLDSIPDHQVVVGDAFRFVVDPESYGFSKHQFDVIIVDVTLGDESSDLIASGNFLSALKSLGMPGSLIIFNRIYLQKYQDKVHCFMDLLAGFFSNIQTKIIAGYTNSDNILIYAKI